MIYTLYTKIKEYQIIMRKKICTAVCGLGRPESDVYSDVVQEARWNDLLHTARLLIRLDTPLHGNNARGAKYAVYYASVATHPVFENIKMAALRAMSEEKSCSPFPCFFIP